MSTDGKHPFVPMLGTGTGGSSTLYGMVLERFFAEDFSPREYFPDVPDARVPDSWPIGLSDLQPYYTEAEELYRVRAARDPLRPPGRSGACANRPRFSPANAELYEHFQRKGLHPYYLPMACDYQPGCRECIGFICPKKSQGRQRQYLS